ncbi:hypothetical protein PLICRDRAFT_26943 [Plicaturopsis crispa FD-325 SS-3]|nr:hypothetical protein PLICRDRAFT_26943 [Plicaturopsis crispa FD-325 SS-3]
MRSRSAYNTQSRKSTMHLQDDGSFRAISAQLSWDEFVPSDDPLQRKRHQWAIDEARAEIARVEQLRDQADDDFEPSSSQDTETEYTGSQETECELSQKLRQKAGISSPNDTEDDQDSDDSDDSEDGQVVEDTEDAKYEDDDRMCNSENVSKYLDYEKDLNDEYLLAKKAEDRLRNRMPAARIRQIRALLRQVVADIEAVGPGCTHRDFLVDCVLPQLKADHKAETAPRKASFKTGVRHSCDVGLWGHSMYIVGRWFGITGADLWRIASMEDDGGPISPEGEDEA